VLELLVALVLLEVSKNMSIFVVSKLHLRLVLNMRWMEDV
jgi:hypothetical protein